MSTVISSEKESGVLVMKDGRAWGKSYSDGKSTDYWWISPCKAEIHNPEYCKKPTDVTYAGSLYEAELRTGKLVHVTKEITVTTKEKDNDN